MRIDKDLVAASATPLVLGILSEQDSYGYAIVKRVRELSGGELDWTDGMLYPSFTAWSAKVTSEPPGSRPTAGVASSTRSRRRARGCSQIDAASGTSWIRHCEVCRARGW